MQIYPAIKARMGDWDYYVVKMRMREVAAEVKFGSHVHNDFTLDEAIQRTLNEGRVKKQIVSYLTGRRDRFFASLVVAVIGGSPKFFPVTISEDPQFELFADEDSFDQAFGVLRFSGDQDYYALDGQHRLKAIQSILRPDDPSESIEPPPGFENEEISVLLVIRPAEDSDSKWLQSYRRLFSSLNRYAKPTDRDTNIIMDEDDVFAILTRRLIATHNFFRAPGRHLDSLRVKTKGKSLQEGTSHFTSLQQLYDMNRTLLATSQRASTGWGIGPRADRIFNIKSFTSFRPPEEYVELLFDELSLYWDALIDAIPDLSLAPGDARNHESDGTDGDTSDNVLFWPIGQDVMTITARALLDRGLSDPGAPSAENAVAVLAPLGKVDWGLHSVPWRGLLLTWNAHRGNWRWGMRNESRKEATRTAERVLRWISGAFQTNEQEEADLRNEWEGQLILPPDEDASRYWNRVRLMRDRVNS